MAKISNDVLQRLQTTVWPQLEIEHGLPRNILYAIANWETRGSFENNLVSPAGARGIFQLTPIALRQIQMDSGINVDPLNPYSASKGAAILLKRYTRLFANQPQLIVAAYNWGETNVRNFVKRIAAQGKAPMPQETRDYIQNTVPLLRTI